MVAEQMERACDGDLPQAWREQALAVGCPQPARGWRDDPGPVPDGPRDDRARADSEAAITATREALSPYWGL